MQKHACFSGTSRESALNAVEQPQSCQANELIHTMTAVIIIIILIIHALTLTLTSDDHDT